MIITIYQIPIGEYWGQGEPSGKALWDSRIIAQGHNYEEVLTELVQEVNDEHIDDVNCYLYIKREEL